MSNNQTFLNVEYTLYSESTRHSLIIRESPDGPGDSVILHREYQANPKDDLRLLVADRDIPLLIQALWRRYQDAVRDYPHDHPNPVRAPELLEPLR